MATRTGLDAQLGIAEESTVGTYVEPDRFVEFTSESMSLTIARIESDSIRAGRSIIDTLDWAAGAKTVSGDVEWDVRTKDLGVWLKHALGGVSTSGSGPYTHTFTPGDLFGKGLTVQVGRPDSGGTVRPFSYTGCKVASLSLSAAVGELLSASASLVGQNETTSEALATASYTSASTLFTFVHGAITVGGSSLPVDSFDFQIDNGLQNARHRIGSAVSTEQRQNARRSITCSLEADFASLTQYNLYTGGSETAVVLTFTSGTDVLTVTLNARADGSTPNVGSVDEIPLSIDFVAVGDGSDADACTITLVNGQSAP